MKKIVVTLSIFASLFLVWCQQTEITTDNTNIQTGAIETGAQEIVISNFEECIEAGFPVMESYPRQCNDGTNTYIEEITPDDVEENLFSWESEETTVDTITGANEENWLSWENEETTMETENSNENILLQEKIKAMIERRSQEQTDTSTTDISTTEVWTSTETTNTTQTSTYNDDEITEDDIQALENIIDEIISK